MRSLGKNATSGKVGKNTKKEKKLQIRIKVINLRPPNIPVNRTEQTEDTKVCFLRYNGQLLSIYLFIF